MKIDGIEITDRQLAKIAAALRINRDLTEAAVDYFKSRRDSSGSVCTIWQLCCIHQISNEHDLQDAIYNLSNNLALIRV